MTTYRALEKVEFRDEKGKTVIVPEGKTFRDPPEEANINVLVKHKAVELVKDGEK